MHNSVLKLAWECVLLLFGNAPSPNDICIRLGDLETIPEHLGLAAGLVKPYPESFERLRTWSANLDEGRSALTPLTGVP